MGGLLNKLSKKQSGAFYCSSVATASPCLGGGTKSPCLSCCASRTAKVNYWKVLWHVLEFVMAQLLGFMIGRNFLNPTFELVHTNPAQ